MLAIHVFSNCQTLVMCKNHERLAVLSFFIQRVLQNKKRLTKRAPDAGDSAHIPNSFLRLVIFLAGRLRRPRPSAGNANRWATKRKR